MLADWKEGSSLDQARELGRVLLEEVGQELSVQEEWGEGEWERVEGLVRDQSECIYRWWEEEGEEEGGRERGGKREG